MATDVDHPAAPARAPRTTVAAGAPQPEGQAHPVLVIDFGAQYAQLIARRVREANVYSEIVPSSITAAEIAAKSPAAIILSGGPSSVYADGAPGVDPALFDTDIPVFGICYGFQAMALALGGSVDRTGRREYGATELTVTDPAAALLHGMPGTLGVWMSHGDAVSKAPDGLRRHRDHRRHPDRRVRERRPAAGRRAVPPRGGAHPVRPGGAAPVPARRRRDRARTGPRPRS